MRMFKIIVVLALTVVMPGQAMAKPPAVVSTMKVDAKFNESALKWSGQPQPGFIIRWRTARINGQIGICGAVHYPSINTKTISRNVLRKTHVIYDNKKILKDMRFFAVVKTRKGLDGAVANCATTGVPAPNNWQLELRWAAGSARL
jgi:hypothetical protein